LKTRKAVSFFEEKNTSDSWDLICDNWEQQCASDDDEACGQTLIVIVINHKKRLP